MSKKEEFKIFVTTHPELVDYVNNDNMSWQKFYDMYALYGKDNEIWDKYFNKKSVSEKEKNTSFSDIFETIKNINPDELQKNIESINKALVLLSAFTLKDTKKEEYTPRPLYKKFED